MSLKRLNKWAEKKLKQILPTPEGLATAYVKMIKQFNLYPVTYKRLLIFFKGKPSKLNEAELTTIGQIIKSLIGSSVN